MQIEGELWRAVARLVADTPLAIMATADGDGAPHAVWMNVVVSTDLEEVIAITLPDTDKVANLRANPRAEWSFSSPSRESFAYLSGPTEILTGDEARRCWEAIPGKTFAYYRNAAGGDSDDPADYAVIRTQVRKVVHARPIGYRKTVLIDRDAPQADAAG